MNTTNKISKGLLIPIVTGLLLTLGTFASTEPRIPFKEPRLYVVMIVFIMLSCIIFIHADHFLSNTTFSDKTRYIQVPRWLSRYKPNWMYFKHHENFIDILHDAGIILMFWLPYLLLLFPGVMYWDTGDQVAQFE